MRQSGLILSVLLVLALVAACSDSPKPASGPSTEEKERLHAFLSVYWEWRNPGMEIEPLNSTDPLSGLREAARDVAEESQDLSVEEIREIDGLLAARGLPTLSQISNSRLQALREVLARRRVANAEEFRLVSSFLSDVSSSELSSDERQLAESMLGEFEANF